MAKKNEKKGEKKNQIKKAAPDEAVNLATAQPEATPQAEEISQPAEDFTCIDTPAPPDSQEPTTSVGTGEKNMTTLTFKSLDKRQRNAIYTGARVSIRIPVAAFPDKKAPETFEAEGLAGPKTKRVAETKEERKARLAAAPKLTAAQRLEFETKKFEKKQQELREEIERGAATELQPAL